MVKFLKQFKSLDSARIRICRHANIACISSRGLNHLHMDIEKRTFCVEDKERSVYFCLRRDGGSDSHIDSSWTTWKPSPLYYITAFCNATSFPKNMKRHYQLKKEVSSVFGKNISIFNGMAFDSIEDYEHGIFVKLDHSLSISDIKHAVEKRHLLGDTPVFSIAIESHKASLKICNDGNVKDYENSYEACLLPLPQIHPAFISRHTNSVYHDIGRCYEVLSCFDYLDEVKELQSICDMYIRRHKEPLPLKANHPVIVVEGLDATGKTTLTRSLAVKLCATVLKSPPECICHLRSTFDAHPQLLRRAFYSLGNYAFASMIKDAAQERIVIADRFWNATAAYAIATDVSVGGVDSLPPVNHEVYNWPGDLLKPNAVILLTVNDEERRKRLRDRGSVKTDEEIRLEQSSPFRKRLEEAYRRMDEPKAIEIDASGTKEVVLDKTLELLKSGDYI